LRYFLQPLSHSAAQKSLLVQVFLASILCLLHFANYVFNNENILFRSLVKRKFYIPIATPLPTLQKFLYALERLRFKRKFSSRATKTFPKLCYIIEYYNSLQSVYIVFLVFAMKL
jgi:hypothetical protein